MKMAIDMQVTSSYNKLHDVLSEGRSKALLIYCVPHY